LVWGVAPNLKEQGAKFSFKFKIADLKMEKFTKFYKSAKANEIYYLSGLTF